LFRCLRGVAMATAPLHLSRRLLGEGRRCAPPPPVFTESQPLEPLFPVTDRHHFSGAIVPDHLSFTSIPGVQLPSLSSTVRTPSSSQSAPEPPPPRPRPRAPLRRASESRSATVLEPLEVLPSQSRRNTVLLPASLSHRPMPSEPSLGATAGRASPSRTAAQRLGHRHPSAMPRRLFTKPPSGAPPRPSPPSVTVVSELIAASSRISLLCRP
jgi:hypothetical protein